MADVLVIDDNDYDAELTLHVLRRCRPELSLFRLRDGRQGLQYLTRTGGFCARISHDPQLIICDVQMPNLGGLDFVEAIRANRLTAHIPTVLFSGSDNPVLHEEALAAGAHRFLSKPSHFNDYCARVESIALQWLDAPTSEGPPSSQTEAPSAHQRRDN